MKHITLIIGLLVVGCGEVENGAYKHRPKQTDTNESTPTTNTNEVSGTTEKPVKELTAEDKVVGEYARGAFRGRPVGRPKRLKEGEYTLRIVLLENGVGEGYKNGKKNVDYLKWSISEDGELHIVDKDGDISVFRINKDKSLTGGIATIDKDGKRTANPKEDQLVTLKKIN